MKNFFEISSRLTGSTSVEIVRSLYHTIDWRQRLIGILGARGTGKTTLMLQFIKQNYTNPTDALYVSLDKMVLFNQSLYEVADWFYKSGGVHLFLDEVHKYPTWAMEVKSIYDDFPSLKIVFSGSPALLLQKAEADLSRRASVYRLHNLSFREFIHFSSGLEFPQVTLDDILQNHTGIANNINLKIRPLAHFGEYLAAGAYPYYFENKVLYFDQVAATVKTIIENDLMAIGSFSYSSLISMQKVLSMIADSVPFKPNISELSRKAGIARDILLKMIDLLVRADLLMTLRQNSMPTGYLTKPEKLYLQNTTLSGALSFNRQPDIGSVRETFFLNQVGYGHQVTLPDVGDFLVDSQHTFEIGGSNKTSRQIKGIDNSFVVQDNLETGYGNVIPLWLFGFLY
jgi:uncharacterized protein